MCHRDVGIWGEKTERKYFCNLLKKINFQKKIDFFLVHNIRTFMYNVNQRVNGETLHSLSVFGAMWEIYINIKIKFFLCKMPY